MSDEILIRVDRVSRYYGTRCALNEVSFNASKGQITGFLGPNGAGKTTLMQIICGVLAASSGNVSIAGHDILEQPIPAKRLIGYLPEHPPLYSDCTVDEYLRYCARLRKISSADIENKLAISKKKCGLIETGKQLVSLLSKGYQQRLGLAQAILHSPQILILDEPSSGLDPKQMIEMRELISNIGEQHCVILSTHILAEAQGICDRILIINMGNIVLDKPLDKLSSAQTSEEVMIAGFTNPSLSLQAIKAVAGVTQVTKIGHNRYRISGNNNILADSLANAATTNNWGLNELGRDTNSLEQVYVNLTKDNTGNGSGQNHDH